MVLIFKNFREKGKLKTNNDQQTFKSYWEQKNI